MNYDFSKIKTKNETVKDWLKKELGGLRTGRATPALVDGILVDSYGSKTPLKHVAAISVEDAKTIKITPWDHSLFKNIEHAIVGSPLGIQPIADKESIRITLPQLTEERRRSLLKILSEKIEEAKISFRQIRDEAWHDIQEKQKNGEISEDDKFRFKNELQKIIDGAGAEIDSIGELKEKEIMK